MATWSEEIEVAVLAVLEDVPARNGDGHHLGRPYLSGYQIAIEIERRFPDVFAAVGKSVGGAGVGEQSTLAQYLSGQLSGRIGRDQEFPVEGVFMSNLRVQEVRYSRPGAAPVVSSLDGATSDLVMYRVRR